MFKDALNKKTDKTEAEYTEDIEDDFIVVPAEEKVEDILDAVEDVVEDMVDTVEEKLDL